MTTPALPAAPGAGLDPLAPVLSPAQGGAEDRVLVFDFGSQTAQLIARRVREQHVFCQIVRPDLSADRVRELNPKGLILSGGPASVYADGAPQPDPGIFDLGVPVLGICYGMQVLARALGCEVKPGVDREFGRTTLTVADRSDPLFDGLPSESTVWMSHGDQVEGLQPFLRPARHDRHLPRRPPLSTGSDPFTGCSSTRRSPTPSTAAGCWRTS